MITRSIWSNTTIPALGLGCWAIGGPFYSGQTPLGWGMVDDAQSESAIRHALACGIRFFDTAQVYGAGHSETVLGRVLEGWPEVLVGTKVGLTFDERTKQVLGQETAPDAIIRSIDASMRRLKRDRIDLVQFHISALPVAEAEGVFDCLAELRDKGRISAFGWSTDFPDHAAAFASRQGFVSIQHAMNVFFKASDLLPVIERNDLLSINRSPLAMGLLTGKFDRTSRFGTQDIRSQTMDWMAYFKDGKVDPRYQQQLDTVRELLCSDGRTLTQGAIGWLWARSVRTLPIPGFRTLEQVDDLAGALEKGALSEAVMMEIENVIVREPEGPARER
jgi:aryl-alcohol dehydrogenase-like predicted oxidoreductase